MAVSAEDIRVVEESLPLIREHLEPVSMKFYENLFAVAPELRGMFRGDIASQGMRFMSTLATIADALDDPEALELELGDLAHAHQQIGIKAEHFTPMGSALLVTLGETLGEEFSPRIQEAWRAAYEEVAKRMIERGGFR